MHILFNAMLLNRRCSGVENAILNLARALAATNAGTGDTLTILVPHEWQDCDFPGEGVRVRRINLPAHIRTLRIAWEQAVLPGLALKLKADLVHAPGYVLPLNLRVPAVLSVYDCQVFTTPQWCRLANRIHYRLLMPASVARARRIIVPSAFTRHELSQCLPGSGLRTRIVPLGVSSAFVPMTDPSQRDALRRQLQLPDHYILHVGRLDPRKNLDSLVRWFTQLRARHNLPHHLVLAGPPDRDSARIAGLLDALGPDSRIHRTGRIDPASLPAFYALADLFVYPSRHEGFGLPPLEAMASGTPVIASTAGAIPEVTGDAAIGLDPDDATGWITAMHTVLTDGPLRAARIRLGLERARRFSWEQTAIQTRTVYREAFNTGSAPS